MIRILDRAKTYGELVAFSHTIFALPFAASAAVLALSVPHTRPTPLRVAAMLACMVTARTSAMAFNRFADRDVDARNPRTSARPVPSGRVRPLEALALTGVSGALFVGAAATLGRVPGLLAVPVLLVLLGYSLAKRFTWGAHAWLGVALSLAPGGAWIAMGAAPSLGIVALMFAVVTWLLGFDVLYSLQDEGFDRGAGLHSIPSRFGAARALTIAAASHTATAALLVGAGALLGRSVAYFVGAGAMIALLVVEHALVRGPKVADAQGKLVRRPRLDRINKVFFDCNAWAAVAFFACVVVDAFVR
ncbi:MAG: putative 4-hydroxybenzoate polyprenyltransferase [Myxococcales bacterium]|nr:putative 4-hydroxybenzoate polyprenyltransferase [Myxococcales bacterium]